MILRRLTKHVKEQNWFAVALDFLIVVVGVFLGLQVSNWNEDQSLQARSDQSIVELRREFADIDAAASELSQFYREIVEDLEVLVVALERGEVSPDTSDDITNALAYGEVFGDPPPPSGTFRDLNSSGNLALIDNQKLRLRLIEYDQSLENIVASDANINAMLAQYNVAFRRHVTFSAAHAIPDGEDFSFQDVSLPLVTSFDFEAMRTDPDFSVAAQQHLRLQIGRYINIRISQSKIRQIRDILDADDHAD
ncbi:MULTISPECIES: hypothetical protein [Henriciella]|uniref:hypothetical protein n=1 Tax=Henriciella TaxID=453849 RepID=UPI003514878C